MRLQAQLTIAFAAVALAPIAGMAGLARMFVSNQYRGAFQRELSQAEEQVGRERQRMGDELRQALGRFARPDDPFVHSVLFELERGPLDDDFQQTLAEHAESQMHALGFDVLTLLDDRGTVLAKGHFKGEAGNSDSESLARARSGGVDAHLVEEKIVDNGHPRTVLAFEAARTIQLLGARPARLTVIGGRLLGPSFLGPLHETARILSLDNVVLAKKDRGAAPGPHAQRRLVALTRADGTPAAYVEFWQSDAGLQHDLQWINIYAVVLALAGLLVAGALGALVAPRLTRSLENLADGARAVSRGELDTTVEVRGSGELSELGGAFNTMTRDLRTARDELVRAERVAAWREIAQRIAHEIKNPLTPIQMAIETLQRAHAKSPEVFDALFAESARTILDEVARLKHIVGEFSAFARMPSPALKACSVGEVVEAALSLYAGAVPLERELEPGLPPALADRDQLTQVLLNLVENAREAVSSQPDARGRIQVRTRRAGARIELEVADTGPGLSDEARDKLFTPYFTTKARGTGLGLAIVQRIVSDHGGEIRVGGAPGQGAVFTISLPLA